MNLRVYTLYMKSKWYESRPEATRLRKMGFSLKRINKRLGVPLSTLSGWLRNVNLSERNKSKLRKDWEQALIRARAKATLWHNHQKEIRLKKAEEEALVTLSNLDIKDKNVLDLALAMLYLGEGFKGREVGMGNSDATIMKFFLAVLRKNYGVDIKNIICELHLRADQNGAVAKSFWSKELNIPIENFRRVYFDQRTKGSKTYSSYNGVCMIRLGHVAIQRKLIYLSNLYCERIVSKYLRG